MLPFANDERRPLMCAILDTLVIFVRHNIRLALDMDTYIVALQLVQRCMFALKTARVRLGTLLVQPFGLTAKTTTGRNCGERSWH